MQYTLQSAHAASEGWPTARMLADPLGQRACHRICNRVGVNNMQEVREMTSATAKKPSDPAGSQIECISVKRNLIGLKILWSESSVRVRPPPPALKAKGFLL